MYETLVALGGYLVDDAERAKPGSAGFRKARADAADVIRSLTGFRVDRVHLTADGISIDDQLRP